MQFEDFSAYLDNTINLFRQGLFCPTYEQEFDIICFHFLQDRNVFEKIVRLSTVEKMRKYACLLEEVPLLKSLTEESDESDDSA